MGRSLKRGQGLTLARGRHGGLHLRRQRHQGRRLRGKEGLPRHRESAASPSRTHTQRLGFPVAIVAQLVSLFQHDRSHGAGHFPHCTHDPTQTYLLFLYGRVPAARGVTEGRLAMHGDFGLVERFEQWFKGL